MLSDKNGAGFKCSDCIVKKEVYWKVKAYLTLSTIYCHPEFTKDLRPK